MHPSQQPILSYYENQLINLKHEISQSKKLISKISFSRLALFIIAITFLYLLFPYQYNLWLYPIIICIALFLFLIKKQSYETEKLLQLDREKIIIENEIDLIKHHRNFYDNGSLFIDSTHPYTSDLDIFGEKSLFNYINKCISEKGNWYLAQMLKFPANSLEIQKRAEAFSDIASDEKKWIRFRAQLLAFNPTDFSSIETKIGKHFLASLQFINSKFLDKVVLIIPYIIGISVLMALIFNGIFYSTLGIILVINFLFYSFYLKKINAVHHQTESYAKKFKSLSTILAYIENSEWQSELLIEKTTSIKSINGEKLQHQFNKLSKIITDLNYRNNLLVGTFLNLFFLWDFKIIKKLFHWHQHSADNVIKCFDLISQFEAYISFATFNYNHPHFVKPEISEEPIYKFNELTHPLLFYGNNISNDFESKHTGEINIITGSNMAGKSTFLRTVAINMVLSFTGCNVSAKYFKTSVFNIVTYMRIVDSLNDATSTFKAEINRLKLIIMQIDKHRDSLIFIDEMLRGTNSIDKYLGSKAFIKFLIHKNVPTFFATHDLQIADLEIEYPNIIRNFYFDVDFENQQMNFDYKIKIGKCNKFNASVLLKEIGIE